MIVGSHNSWSYLPSKKWWMAPFKFIAKCQDLNIIEQYEIRVRCFDLRVRFNKKGEFILGHGFMQYDISIDELLEDLKWLNSKEDTVYIRILHEVRNKHQYTTSSIAKFKYLCTELVTAYPNLIFWCGRNLYNWEVDYEFTNNPSCEEKYSSVCAPKLIDDWYPRWFAKKNNTDILYKGTNKDILLIDFVNYGC